MESWRKRLRHAIEQSPRKRTAIAHDADTTAETISRIVTGASKHPQFETVAHIAHACGVSVGWLLGEQGHALSSDQRRQLREAADIIIKVTT